MEFTQKEETIGPNYYLKVVQRFVYLLCNLGNINSNNDDDDDDNLCIKNSGHCFDEGEQASSILCTVGLLI